ncbi:MAG: hypothetical protein R3B53_02050 [Candidatus Paceibacterota bacterium]
MKVPIIGIMSSDFCNVSEITYPVVINDYLQGKCSGYPRRTYNRSEALW